MRKLSAIVGGLGIVVATATTSSAATIGLVPNNGCINYEFQPGVFVPICDADIAPAGTGVFQPFLRTNSGSKSPSSGWNTDAAINTSVNDADDSWTSALAKAGLTTTTNGYYVFSVDINQNDSPQGEFLSLSHFELFSCTSATYTTLSSGCTSFLNLFGGSVAVTDDAHDRPVITTNQWVDFNYTLHEGSGKGDISIFIPASLFGGATNPYIALLDGWGGTGAGMYQDNDGFQEWRALTGATRCPTEDPDCDVVVPEPASLLLFGMAAFGSAYRIRRRSRRPE